MEVKKRGRFGATWRQMCADAKKKREKKEHKTMEIRQQRSFDATWRQSLGGRYGIERELSTGESA